MTCKTTDTEAVVEDHHKSHHEARIQSERLYREGWKEVEAELRD